MKRLVFGALFAAGIIAICFTMSGTSEKKLRIGIFGSWKTLHPGLQHTLAGDLVLSNQFNPLVGINARGVIQPLGAVSWEISKDFRQFSFRINTKLKFSDGSSLRAQDFKRSWEDALRLVPKSANSSQKDVLYRVEGYDRFERTGFLSGLVVENDETLVLKFSSPLRTALFELVGTRYAAFKDIENRQIGTGKYVIHPKESFLDFIPNRFHPEKDQVTALEVSTVAAADVESALVDGKIDVWGYGFLEKVPARVLADGFEIIPGQDAGHDVIALNGLKGRLFEKKEHRLAFQYLVVTTLLKERDRLGDSRLTMVDPQCFLPVQGGRLLEADALSIVSEGQPYVAAFLEAAKQRPLVVVSSKFYPWVLPFLKELGMTVSDGSRTVGDHESMEYAYKRDDYDVFPSGFSVAHGDPDGVYHAYGRNGAILNPVTFREAVGAALEIGRDLTDVAALDERYKEINRVILREVPVVHLGFIKSVSIINPAKVEAFGMSNRRNEGHLDVFRVRSWSPL